MPTKLNEYLKPKCINCSKKLDPYEKQTYENFCKDCIKKYYPKQPKTT